MVQIPTLTCVSFLAPRKKESDDDQSLQERGRRTLTNLVVYFDEDNHGGHGSASGKRTGIFMNIQYVVGRTCCEWSVCCTSRRLVLRAGPGLNCVKICLVSSIAFVCRCVRLYFTEWCVLCQCMWV